MFKIPAATLTCLLLPLLPGDALRSEATKGQTITRTFNVITELELDELSIMVDGGEVGGHMGDFQHDITTEMSLEIRDTILESEEGATTKLERTFASLEKTERTVMAGPMGDKDETLTLTSELDGAKVIFTLGDEGFEAAYAEDEEGDDEWLEGLDALLDFANLVPGKEVAEGDTWDVPLEFYSALSKPAGKLRFQPEDMEHEMPDGDSLEFELDGEIRATLKAYREVDDVRYAVITLSVETTRVVDRTEFFNAMRENVPDDMPEGAMMPDVSSATEESSFEGEGEVLWNVEAGRLHSIELSGDFERIEMMEMTMSMGEMEQTMEQTTTMVGTRTFEVQFED